MNKNGVILFERYKTFWPNLNKFRFEIDDKRTESHVNESIRRIVNSKRGVKRMDDYKLILTKDQNSRRSLLYKLYKIKDKGILVA